MSDSEEDDNKDRQLKIVFVGESNVGKTSIIRRFCYDDFTRQYNQTIGADFHIRRLMLPGKQEVKVRITDVGGLELNGHMLGNYLFNANMIILVYDITNSCTFDCLPIWLKTIKQLNEKAPINAVIGNKCDLEHQRAVRLDKTRMFVENWDLYHFLVSGKTGEAVNVSLIDLIAKHFDIPLSRVDREHQQSIVKAELITTINEQTNRIPPTKSTNNENKTNTTVCCLQ